MEEFDINIPENQPLKNFTIIYKGKQSSQDQLLGDEEEEKLIEIKTNKVELCKKLQYFNRKLSEIYHEKEIFIHDTFDCDLFQDFINSILTNHIKINAKNCFEYLNLSNKYEYTEMQHQITQFIQQRPDLRLIITQISNTERNVNNNNWDDDDEEETDENSEDPFKEEIISENIDVCLINNYLDLVPLPVLNRILNSPKLNLSNIYYLNL